VLAAVSLMATRGETTPLSLTMMGGPIDARKSPTAVNNLAMNKPFSWFENNVIYKVPANFEGAGRRVYPGFLQHSGFVAMNPQNHRNSHFDYFNDLIKGDNSSAESHRKFYDEYNAVLDMDADYYLETIATVFQDFKLVNGTWDVKNVAGKPERVKPADIKTSALLTVEGELDDISGSGQTKAAHDLCSGIPKSLQQHYEAKGAGHYGIFSGRRWREMVYPQVKSFILAHHVAPKTVVKSPAKAAEKTVAAPVAKPVAKAVANPVATTVAKPAVKVVKVNAVVKSIAKPVAKPAVKAVSKPVTVTVQAPQSKVKTTWVAAPKK
jgi:poly(3-hydroxybutyrate) depolymerase